MAFASNSFSDAGVTILFERLSGDSVRDSIGSTFERSGKLTGDTSGASPWLAKELSFSCSRASIGRSETPTCRCSGSVSSLLRFGGLPDHSKLISATQCSKTL
jgi:hypothetical protein